MKQSRRRMITAAVAASTLSTLVQCQNLMGHIVGDEPHIATNTYPWLTFARRAKQDFALHTDQLLSDISETGVVGYEPIITNADEFAGLGQRLMSHGLEMRSIYVNSVLHDSTVADDSMASVVSIAKEAKKLGVKIVVTNPSPIRWGGPEDKSDDQLQLQAKSLDSLGDELRKMGLVLAYHNHDAELRQGAREFHHMLTATSPDHVKFCLDAHWIYRGCGDSQVALFDAIAHYRDRIVELHLRQSLNGVWAEAFTIDGDIDYRRLLDSLAEHSIHPHLVLEQAVEDRSPRELTVVEAHRQSNRNLTKALA